MAEPKKNWFLRRLRPRHYLLLQTEGAVGAPHFLISLSLDDESQYVRYIDPEVRVSNTWMRETIHSRTPNHYDKREAIENIAKAIAERALPPLDIEFSFDSLFEDVGIFEDTGTTLPLLEDYSE